jgi:hypothetical protein
MLRCRTLFWVFSLLALAAAAPASATTVTVEITGTWDTVTDTAGVTDGSIFVGGSFTATLVYDDSIADSIPDPTMGGYDIPAGSSDLSFITGSYSFVPGSGVGIAIDDGVSGQDAVFLFAETYTSTGPYPGGVSTGGTTFANPSLIDSSATAHTSDALTDLTWTLSDYNLANFYFFTEVLGAGAGEFLELDGTITGLTVLPEPSSLILVVVGGFALLARSRRG